MRLLLIAGLCATGCGFSVNGSGPGDGGADARTSDGPNIDGATDAPIDAPDNCFGRGIGSVCLTSPPTQPLALGDTVFDTGGNGCMEVITKNGVALCVLAGTTVSLPTGTFRATGSRPLVVVATTSMTIQGTLDVSSNRTGTAGAGAGTGACGTAAIGANDTGGGGGGAGGSFGGRGGDGGPGDANDSGAPSGTSNVGSKLYNSPSPSHARHMPCGLLKLKSCGLGGSKLMPQCVQA